DDASLYLPCAQKFSKPKSIIDELSAWRWKAPPPAAYLELACCIRRALVEFLPSELTLVPVFVPVFCG
ncbi:MAG: hypothetical protein QGF29_02520, partial [Verrucomicrobiota bacterium]|nr:hypothetical protein [Verrucomicrobiota bacterium]